MKKSKSISILFFALGLFWSVFAFGQESTNASGGDATGSGGTLAYSIGQVDYTTHIGSLGSSAQGVQHAYEIFSSSLEELDINISLNVFPNPTTENLTLEISDYQIQKLSYHLFDNRGKHLGNAQIESQQTIIKLSQLPQATYFLDVVTDQNIKVHSFKIIKN